MRRSLLRWFGFAGLFFSISFSMGQAPQYQDQGQGGNGFNGGGRQFGGGGQGGGRGFGGGAMGGGGNAWAGGGGQGGGQGFQGGGGQGFGRGGMGGGSRDGMSQGAGNGQMTREQIGQMMQAFGGRGGGRGGRNGGGWGGGMGGGGNPWGGMGGGGGNPWAGGMGGGGWNMNATGGGGDHMANMADIQFRKLDQNADGVLNYDEMTETLRSEIAKWDTNNDRVIDQNEFKAYFQGRMQQMLGENGGAGEAEAANTEEERRPVVYRAGKLPKELPGWFAEMDTDHDAQVALYEWKHSGRSIAEFESFDRNGDGFLTVDEVLHVTKATAGGPGGPGRMMAGFGGFPGGENFSRNSFSFPQDDGSMRSFSGRQPGMNRQGGKNRMNQDGNGGGRRKGGGGGGGGGKGEGKRGRGGKGGFGGGGQGNFGVDANIDFDGEI